MIQLRLPMVLALIVLPAGLAAQQDRSARKPSQSAKSLRLDLGKVPVDDGITQPAVTTVAEPGRTASRVAALYTLDTPIERLLADPCAKSVLDKDVPGLSDDENLPRFRALSLRGFQPLTGGQLTDALMAQVEGDLAVIKSPAKAKGRNAGR